MLIIKKRYKKKEKMKKDYFIIDNYATMRARKEACHKNI